MQVENEETMRHSVPRRKRCWIDIQQRFLFALPVIRHSNFRANSVALFYSPKRSLCRTAKPCKTLAARGFRPLNSPFADHWVGI
ncbi:hypothetical protein Bxe_A0022 [Paraburkholderia xenovorans LB400]|uniref:Uncharacterized protein n=1 Tax=Paraburkholderia xenovorans (strain LB400) TaxID=266265 RepID=Q13SN4_PARXL|nr:hypothetical protein Bxe_A0022 [Paraburkholderia xenovorans LB400]